MNRFIDRKVLTPVLRVEIMNTYKDTKLSENTMNTLFILIALTFSNGQMYDAEVTGNIWKSYDDCIVEYKKLSNHQSNNTKFVCMVYNNK